MANNLIIIDFFGIPGCGKSLISHELACIFASQDIKVKEMSYNMDHHNTHVVRLIKKVFFTLLYAFIYPKSFIRLVKTIKQDGNFTNSFSQIRNIGYKLLLLNKANSIVILDEGIAQSSLSVAFGTEKKCIAIYKMLQSLIPRKFNLVTVYLDVPVEQAMDNMAKRSTNDSRIEKISNEQDRRLQIMSFMEKTKELSQIADVSIKIKGRENIKNIVSKIVEQLNSKQKIQCVLSSSPS